MPDIALRIILAIATVLREHALVLGAFSSGLVYLVSGRTPLFYVAQGLLILEAAIREAITQIGRAAEAWWRAMPERIAAVRREVVEG